MKNITVTVDDETYRRARIASAEAGTSVSALVREYLRGLSRRERSADLGADLFAALDRAEAYRAADRLSREETHARSRLR